MAAAVVENFGYRQWLACVRAKALLTLLKPGHGWGEMSRTTFGAAAAEVEHAAGLMVASLAREDPPLVDEAPAPLRAPTPPEPAPRPRPAPRSPARADP
jgi:hypothetical protein